MHYLFFKKTILVVWAIWWTIAFLNDFFAGLQEMGWIFIHWINDMNYPSITVALSKFNAPNWLSFSLYLVVVAWSLVNASLFWRAFFTKVRDYEVWLKHVSYAFIASLVLWFCFIVIDQIVVQAHFSFEGIHMVQAMLQLVCFFAFFILPRPQLSQ